MKDLDWVVLAQDPVLASKVPRPLVEKGHCQVVLQKVPSEGS